MTDNVIHKPELFKQPADRQREKLKIKWGDKSKMPPMRTDALGPSGGDAA